ncbi:MAG: hypothetical protein ACRDNI_06240 [Gaiellaceae bacterium]
MSELRRHRLEENQSLFREVNERIGATADTQGTDVHVYEFVCECASIDCFERFELSLGEYHRVRERAECFLVVTGHERPEAEEIVERLDKIAAVEPRPAGEAAAAGQ